MFRIAKRFLLLSVATLVLLGAVQGSDSLSASEVAVAPHKYSLVRWEIDHFTDKWVHKLQDILPWNSELSREDRIAQAQEFFDLGAQVRELERDLPAAGDAANIMDQIELLRQRRSDIQPDVEETMESEISAVLVQEGFSSRIGVIFPPVDTVYASSPGVLIISPRDRIVQDSSTLLKPGIPDSERERLEDLIFREDGMSALIVSTSGVATFPSVVSASGTLHEALVTTAHEWLHHWFFFQPLGQHFWDNADMTTLNEPAATLGGREMGGLACPAVPGVWGDRAPAGVAPAGRRWCTRRPLASPESPLPSGQRDTRAPARRRRSSAALARISRRTGRIVPFRRGEWLRTAMYRLRHIMKVPVKLTARLGQQNHTEDFHLLYAFVDRNHRSAHTVS